MEQSDNRLEQATFGAGCFWCVEAVFQQLNGVKKVEAGYAGGEVKNPSYREVCTGRTGHAEVAQVTYNPEVIDYETLLEVFWHAHNPTTLNRQGADKGTQYRSAIFYHNDEQKRKAAESLAKTDASDLWDDPIVTTLEPLDVFYPAEDYHQDYFKNNEGAPYCNMVIKPKLEKLQKEFPGLLK